MVTLVVSTMGTHGWHEIVQDYALDILLTVYFLMKKEKKTILNFSVLFVAIYMWLATFWYRLKLHKKAGLNKDFLTISQLAKWHQISTWNKGAMCKMLLVKGKLASCFCRGLQKGSLWSVKKERMLQNERTLLPWTSLFIYYEHPGIVWQDFIAK